MWFVICFVLLIIVLKALDRLRDPHGASDFSVQVMKGIEESKKSKTKP